VIAAVVLVFGLVCAVFVLLWLMCRRLCFRVWTSLAQHTLRRGTEATARGLLRSCLEPRDWVMYRELGFVRVHGDAADPLAGQEEPRRSYLIYPHRPIISYVAAKNRPLCEHHIVFGKSGGHLPLHPLCASDDVLCKWMALTGDEHGVLHAAIGARPGSGLKLAKVHRDLGRLARWDLQRGNDPDLLKSRDSD
jgi:hypothetical protein